MTTQSATPQADIHCMCAAHINNPQRLLRLGQMLASWRQQQHYLPSLSMSLSHNLADRMYHDAIANLQQYSRDNGKLSITHQSKPTRQGHHYLYLVRTSDIDNDSWVMWTDDDDVWSPTRTATLASVLSNLPHSTTLDAVLIPSHARHAERIADVDRRVCLHAATALGTQASALDISSADDVAACLTAGTLSHCHALSLGAGCYWAYAVRRRVLIDFFQKASDALLAHRAWDLALIRYIRTACQLHVVPPVADWMYYWRIDTAAAHNPPDPTAYRRRQLLGLLEAHCALTHGHAVDWEALEAAGVDWGVHVDQATRGELEALWTEARVDLQVLLMGPRGTV